jgi:hypothetical protein
MRGNAHWYKGFYSRGSEKYRKYPPVLSGSFDGPAFRLGIFSPDEQDKSKIHGLHSAMVILWVVLAKDLIINDKSGWVDGNRAGVVIFNVGTFSMDRAITHGRRRQ